MTFSDAERQAGGRRALSGVLWGLGAAVFVVATVLGAWWAGRPKEPALPPVIGASGPGHDLDMGRIEATIRKWSAFPSRVTGYGGDRKTFEMILAELKQLGLGEDEIQVQEFTVPSPMVESASLTGRAGGQDVVVPLHPLWPNLGRTCQTPPAGLTGPLVDVGRCTDHELKGKTLAGAILVMDWDCDTEWLSAPEFGAKAVLFRGNERGTGYTARNKFLTVPANVPRFYVTEADQAALARLMTDAKPARPAGGPQAADAKPQAAGAKPQAAGAKPARPAGGPQAGGANPQGAPATIRCRMAWRAVTGRNVLARVSQPDEDDAQAPVIFHAYYDSISVVPGLSPGAEQACGAATLLELARFFRHLPKAPPRPVYVLLTGGHGQALSGMIHFVNTLYTGLSDGWSAAQADTLLARMGSPGLMVGLDLSSRSDRMGVFCMGKFRVHHEGQQRAAFKVLGQKLGEFARSASAEAVQAGEPDSFVDCINLTMGRGWDTFFPYPAPFESEVPTLAALPAVTFSTLNDARRRVDTPHDTADRLQMDLLARQIRDEPGRRVGLANLAVAVASWDGPFVGKDLTDRWARIHGRVVWLNQRKDYTPSQPLAGATVFVKTNQGEKYLMGTRGIAAALADKDGAFRVDGLSRPLNSWTVRQYQLEAYGTASEGFLAANPGAREEYFTTLRRAGRAADKIERDGSILFAVDMARPGEYPWQVKILKAEQNINLVCFPCKSISLFGLTDPREYIPLSDLQILDAATQSPPFQFGLSASDLTFGRDEKNCITLWAAPTLRVRLTFGFGFQKRRLILINKPDPTGKPEGEGFVLEDLETVPSMMLQGAGDMWNLDQWRFERLKTHGIANPRVEAIHNEAKTYLDQARDALAQKDYRTYRDASEKGWALESKAYLELLDTTNNMIKGVLFYLAVLIPFAYCLERLTLAGGTIRKRIIGMTVIFGLSFGVLVAVHPAFQFTLTPTIVLLAFVILALAATVSVLLVSKFDRLLKERKAVATGLHEDTRNVGQIAIHAVDLGIANIRRRPKRGFLTAMTIVLVTFTLLSFTSLVPELNISQLPHLRGRADSYRGLMVRSRNWAPLPKPLYESIARTFSEKGSVVAGRAWFYSNLTGKGSQVDLSVPRRFRPQAAGAPATRPAKATGHFTAVALLCMEPTEPAVTGIDKALVAGRWFRDEEELGIILPEHVATSLGLTRADVGTATVLLFGKELPLIGLVDSEKIDRMLDIDGERFTPVDFVQQEQQQAERATADKETADTFEEYFHYSSDQVAIIPLHYGRPLGATFRSIAVKTGPTVDPREQAQTYARRSDSTILASDGKDRVTLFASMDTSRISVAGQIVVPVILGFVMVLGTMLGSVYERKKEIFVYNSVGLNPVNVASLFLAESSVYAILGGAMGFLLGQVISKILLATGMLSGLTLNYSAGTTVFVTILTMVIVLLSTLYPARQAFLAAVPETHREGGFGEAQAAANRLSMWMPFVASPGHAAGMQAYMFEYLDSIQGVTVGALAVDNLLARREGAGEESRYVLAFRAWIAPFDLGVSHDVELRIARRPDRNVHQYHLTAELFSGDQQNWRRLMPRFLQAVRKQLLMWRILSAEAIRGYVERGEALFQEPPQRSDVDG